MTARTIFVGLALSIATLGSNAALAAADDGDPGPVGIPGCDFPLVTDDTGDAIVDPSGGFGVKKHAAPDSMDVESANLVWTGGKLVADIGVVNLDKTVPAPTDSQGGVYYYYFFTLPDGTQEFVKSINRTQDGITFGYGHIQQIGLPVAAPVIGSNLFSMYQTDGTTTGKWVEGPDGHVLIDVPASLGVKLGTALTNTFANVDTIQGYDDLAGTNVHVDLAPDKVDTLTPGGADWTVTGCAPAAS
ncbi:MAG: hypothetical protein QOG68_1785 [Solirubrobacteraceae bacterium]|nr:hypothetical protein [Solirubrobacteraceae bacterium]